MAEGIYMCVWKRSHIHMHERNKAYILPKNSLSVRDEEEEETTSSRLFLQSTSFSSTVGLLSYTCEFLVARKKGVWR